MTATLQRRSEGKKLRKAVPRRSRGRWKSAPERPDVITLLESLNDGLLPNLIPIRYARMKTSPFAFYRGTAGIMAYDVGTGRPTTGIEVQACGDCHLENFGAYATPERNVIFDIDDFDETACAPWEWDVERLATSTQLAGRVNNFSAKQNRKNVLGAVSAYRKQMSACARMTRLEVWYSRIDATAFLAGAPRVAPDDAHELVADQYTEGIGHDTRIADRPPKLFHPPPDREVVVDAQEVFDRYRRSLRDDLQVLFSAYRLLDLAVKVVGVGSVGTRCGVGLFMAGENDKLILQIKEARPSVLEAYGGRCNYRNNGRRVIAGQRLMQSASDLFLGWSDSQDGHQFYIRQIADSKWSPDITVMSAERLQSYAALCGQVLAIAHARSGNARDIADYMGLSSTFDEAIAGFADGYAEQVCADYAKFLVALKSGRLTAE